MDDARTPGCWNDDIDFQFCISDQKDYDAMNLFANATYLACC
jgi:hypothetical protein